MTTTLPAVICHGTGDSGQAPMLKDPVPGPFLVDNRLRVQLPDRELELWAVRGTFPSIGNAVFAAIQLSRGYPAAHGFHPNLRDSGLALTLHGGVAHME